MTNYITKHFSRIHKHAAKCYVERSRVLGGKKVIENHFIVSCWFQFLVSLLTIWTRSSRKGRSFISSLSLWSTNQLSIGIPFSNWKDKHFLV